MCCCRSDGHRHLHSFPTRRSTDLHRPSGRGQLTFTVALSGSLAAAPIQRGETVSFGCLMYRGRGAIHEGSDRKSTRLNSSHVKITYAVFCLKKKLVPSLLARVYVP